MDLKQNWIPLGWFNHWRSWNITQKSNEESWLLADFNSWWSLIMKFLVSIENWKIENPQKLSEYIKSRKNGIYAIKVSKFWTRSLAQNSYYWGVVLELIEESTGTEKEELHYYFKRKFIDWDEFPSSKELNKNEFSEYVEKIRDFASAELWIFIPDAVN